MSQAWNGSKLRNQASASVGFADEIAESARCDNLQHCIQCGTCSGVCPMGQYMDHTPRQLIGMIRAGFKDEVLASRSIWLCASCYACTVACPKQIKVTDVMYAAKRRAIREGVYPRGFPIPVLAREFTDLVHSQGRSTESHLVMRLYAKVRPWELLKQARLGWNLFRRGRMGLKFEKIDRKAELRAVLDTMQSDGGR